MQRFMVPYCQEFTKLKGCAEKKNGYAYDNKVFKANLLSLEVQPLWLVKAPMTS